MKLALAAITLAVGLAAAGRAEADETAQARRAAAARERGRPYTMAELSAGFLALPAAQVCLTSLTNCSRGEFSLALGIHNLYRYRAFGFGAGIEWATTLRNDSARGADELERAHTRRYFLVESQVRYYFVQRAATEWWAGATLGGVVVNDSWSVKADRAPYSDIELVGPRAATLGTEGLTAGVAAGFEWTFAKNWSWGMKLRYSSWFLPDVRKVSPTLDVASLSGRVDMFDFGVAIAYRIAL